MRLAIVAEGITDQVVLDYLGVKFFRRIREKDIEITYLQPPVDATDEKQADFGGFEAVLSYCQERLSEAFAVSDHVIIHIDTDIAEHPSLGVALTEQGSEIAEGAVFTALREKIFSSIPNDIVEEFGDRIHVIPSRHSIECWLLNLMGLGKHSGRIRNCEQHLFIELAKRKIKFEKTARFYRHLCGGFKPKQLDGWNDFPEDMKRFFGVLAEIEVA